MLLEVVEKIKELERKLFSLVRIGIVNAVYPEKGTVRVTIKDEDKITTHELPVLFSKTHKDKDYWMPDEGEQVLCLFLSYAVEVGFVVGAVYSSKDQVPVADKNKKHIVFEDGTLLEYDKKAHKLLADVKGEVEVTATGNITAESKSQIILKAPQINIQNTEGSSTVGTIIGDFSIKGNLDVDGNIHATGTIIDDGGNTNHHTH